MSDVNENPFLYPYFDFSFSEKLGAVSNEETLSSRHSNNIKDLGIKDF